MEKNYAPANILRLEPIIDEQTELDRGNLILALLLALAAIGSLLFIISFFALEFSESLKAVLMVLAALSLIAYILIKPSTIRNIYTREIQTINKPIIRHIKKPYPVIQEVIKEIEKPKKKIEIPKYKYKGSEQSQTYHKTSCRFSKLIKNKHKISRNDIEYFKKRKFKPCKVCKPDKN